MHITNLNQLASHYRHIYLSPHLDDAALSCGGAIAAQRAAGEPVLVVTLCTGVPAAEGPFNRLAHEFHANWGLSAAEVVTARLGEDQAAMALLDADWYWAGLLDAIYRLPAVYDDTTRLFGSPAADDPLLAAVAGLVRGLATSMPQARFYAPLGIGSHVDHLLTWAAVRACGIPFLAYEDLPYGFKAAARTARLAELAPTPATRLVDISTTIGSKTAAIAAYTSQLAALFGTASAMPTAIADHAAAVAHAAGVPPSHAEQLWVCS